MGDVDDRVMRRIAKVLALAEQGVDGEKAAAEAMLATLLRKYGLTLEDIGKKEERRQWVELTFSSDYELTLLAQIIRKVTQQTDLPYKKLPRTRGKHWFELTPAEHIEIEFMFGVMKTRLHQEFDKMLSAFIHKNQLYGPRKETGAAEEDTPLDAAQMARIKQISAIMMTMDSVQLHKAIGAK